jgi:hypothetical protein
MHPFTRNTYKAQLKTLAKDLHDSKRDLREHMKANSYKIEEQWHITKAKKQYRALHVAYCMARGRKLEEVEAKVSLDNPLDLSAVQVLLNEIQQLDLENDEKFPKKTREEQANEKPA